jgi:pSer/pThr/pTyr-binding forkhead associated (FHA) protein
MRENDLVINNLSVSRFHAVLSRVPDGFRIEDLGGENGTFVNERRANGSTPVAFGDEVRIGKHVLVLREGASVAADSEPNGPSDAWDAAQTYFALDTPLAGDAAADDMASQQPAAVELLAEDMVAEEAPAVTAEEDLASAAELVREDLAPVSDLADSDLAPAADLLGEVTDEPLASLETLDDGPDPEGAFAFGEDDLAEEPLAAGEFLEADSDPLPEPVPPEAPSPGSGGEHTALFEFGVGDELSAPDPIPLPTPQPPSEPSFAADPEPGLAPPAPEPMLEAAAPEPAAETGLHAGIIVQRRGQLEQVVSWQQAELIVGRSTDCDLQLAAAEVSRRHACFSCNEGHYEVRDLGSVNGVLVNGLRTPKQVLSTGDVVSIEDFELTFVLDDQPVGDSVRVAPPTLELRPEDAEGFTQLASLSADDDATTGLSDAPALAEDELLVGVEAEPWAEEKPDAASAQEPLQLELALELEPSRLPAPLREALLELGDEGVSIPATIRLRGARERG